MFQEQTEYSTGTKGIFKDLYIKFIVVEVSFHPLIQMNRLTIKIIILI